MTDGILGLEQTLFGQYMLNVLVFSNFPDTLEAMQETADQLRIEWNASIGNLQSNQWTLNSLLFTVNPGPSQFSTRVAFGSGPLSGGSSGDPLPNQVSLLVSTSALTSRPNRGRIYLPGLTEPDCVAGLFNSTVRNAAESLFNDWATVGLDNTFSTMFLRIARRSVTGAISVSNPVDNVLARPVPAVQRRRRREG